MPFGKKVSTLKKAKKVDPKQRKISFNPFAASQSSQSSQATQSLDPWSDEDESTCTQPTLSSYHRSVSSPSISCFTTPESLMTPVMSDLEDEDDSLSVDLRFTPCLLDSSPCYSHLTGYKADSTHDGIEFPVSPWTEGQASPLASPLAYPLVPTTPPLLVSRQSSLESYLNRENVNRLVVSPARRIIFSRQVSNVARRLFEPLRDKLILVIILLLSYLFVSQTLSNQFRRQVFQLLPNTQQDAVEQILQVVQEVVSPTSPEDRQQARWDSNDPRN